jgi:general secretion pathway protein A
MYQEFYSLSGNPFDLTPNPDMLFMSDMHQEALAVLGYGVVTRKGFLVLTGDVGTGKTTLLNEMIRTLKGKSNMCLVSNPALSRAEFLYFLAQHFDLDYQDNKTRFLLDFARYLKECRQKDERVLILIDEAHVLSIGMLEEIRLLSNQDLSNQQVLSIFLIGQPELNEHMSDDRLLPLRQRIGIRFHLKPFNLDETKQYILFRLGKCKAANPNLFTEKALFLIHEFSKGIPRVINVICDNALLTGFSGNKKVIDAEIIKECINELGYKRKQKSSSLFFRTSKNQKKWMVLPLAVTASFLLIVIWFSKIVPEEWFQYLRSLTGGFGDWFWRLVWENFLRQ